MKIFILFCVFFGCILVCHAQKKDSQIAAWWVEKFKITDGLFVPVNNTKIQVGANGSAAGTDIDFNKDLGFGSSSVTFLANAQWRISRRSRLNLGYYNISGNSKHTLQKDITFDSTTYHANTTVDTYS
jgi:hypothetical protein